MIESIEVKERWHTSICAVLPKEGLGCGDSVVPDAISEGILDKSGL